MHKKVNLITPSSDFACRRSCQVIKEQDVFDNSIWLYLNSLVGSLDNYKNLDIEQKGKINNLFRNGLTLLKDLDFSGKELLGQEILQSIQLILREEDLKKIKEEEAIVEKLTTLSQKTLCEINEIITQSEKTEKKALESKKEILEVIKKTRKRSEVIAIIEAKFEEVIIRLKEAKAECQKTSEKVIQTQKELKGEAEEKEKLKQMAVIDNLTQIYNRRYFDQQLPEIVESFLRDSQGKSFSLVYLDLDFFKTINDTYGHPVGDAVLKRTAEVIQNHCRAGVDNPIRLGGDEFAIFLPGSKAKIAQTIAGRIQKQLQEGGLALLNGENISIQSSIGICEIDPQWANMSALELDLDIDEQSIPRTDSIRYKMTTKLIESTDKALYESKRKGRQQITIYQK